MVKLSFDNVVQQFTQLSGGDVQTALDNIGIVENAWRRISVLLDDKRCTEKSVASAEYAAAACAFYDFVCADNAKQKLIYTLTGQASTNIDYKSRIESAKSLRDSALEVIKPVMLGCDFAFSAVEG